MAAKLASQPDPNAKTLVMKFGGTSVATPAAMAQAAEIVRDSLAEWPRTVVVVSALAGVTNMLLDTARQAASGDLSSLYQVEERLRQLHDAIADELLGPASPVNEPARCTQVKQEVRHLINSFSNLCQAVGVLGEATPRALDAISGLGERMSVRLMTAILESLGVAAQLVEATQVIVTDTNFQNAHLELEATRQRTQQVLGPLLARGFVPVVTGFIGATPEGVPTTLGRGGSDYSAAVLGAVLPADDVWIWTDVDGVMTADPRQTPEARTIPVLSYREIAELAYFGAKVLHPKTIRPVVDAGIGLRICNTFHPSHPGTRLVSDSQLQEKNGTIKAVTGIQHQRLITVEGRGMLGVPGVAARTFAAVASTGTSVPLITQASSEQSICFSVPTEAATAVAKALETAFARELTNHDIDQIVVSGETAIVTAVGAGMMMTPGVAGRLFSALGRAGVNIVAIAQGSSEAAVSMVVAQPDLDSAIRAVHALIVEKEESQ
jgi:aspartate kinase